MNFSVNLSELGYWVFPVKDRKKYPSPLRGKKWDEFINENEHELLHAHLLSGDWSGAAMCPQSNDSTPLLILDLDAYGMDLDTLWKHVVPGEEMPDDVLVIKTPTGGWHLWFKLPPDVDAEKLPATFDFGNGVTGEVRVSCRARRLIMLPDSTATNKHGKAGKYQIHRGPTDMSNGRHIEKVGLPPGPLMARLVARKDQGKAEEGNQPTEVLHLIKVLEGYPDIVEGSRNDLVAKIGQILGRMHPSKQLPEELLRSLWKVLAPKLGDFDSKEFQIAIASGWKTGSRNAQKYHAREKHPSVTDVQTECESIFTSVPWIVEVRDSAGKTKEWLAGFGGSAKRRHEADRVVRLKDLRDILPTLTRLTNASMDTVARSPLFIQPGWKAVLEYMLNTEKAVDQLGIPPEERFWELLEEWCRISAGDMLFLEAWTEKRPAGAAVAFIVWPMVDQEPPAMVIPPLLQETILTQIGDIPKAKKLVGKHLLKKTLVGMRSGQTVWVCPISNFDEETQNYIEAQYEFFVQKKGGGDGKEA